MPMTTTIPSDPWSDVTAVILAGGVGSRLKSVVSDRPKGLAEVNGRPFLAFVLEQLVAVGAQRAVFSTGHLAPQIEEAFGNEFQGMRIGYSHEATPLGTGGGLRLAAAVVASPILLVLNGDSYCEVDLTAFLSDAAHNGRAPALVLSRQADTSRFGRVEHGPDGEIGSFHEKGESPGAGWINAGIYALPRELVMAIPEGRPVSLEREVFPAWIGRGLRAFPSEGRFLDIGTPESYREAADFFRAIPPPPPA